MVRACPQLARRVDAANIQPQTEGSLMAAASAGFNHAVGKSHRGILYPIGYYTQEEESPQGSPYRLTGEGRQYPAGNSSEAPLGWRSCKNCAAA